MSRHALTLVLLTASASALAAPSPVPYFFGSAGYTRIDLSEIKDTAASNGVTNISSKDSSASYAGGVGINLNDYVSFEAQYMHIGKFNLSAPGASFTGKLNGIGLGAVGFWPLSRDTSLFLRGDAIYAQANVNGDTAESWEPAAGLGLEHNLGGGLHVRGTYQHIFLRSNSFKTPADNVSLSLLQAF